MAVTTGGARVVPGQHPAIDAIQQAGDALGRMGQLFNQVRQVGILEKQTQNEHAKQYMDQIQALYDKRAAATDPAAAWNELAPLMKSGLTSFGINPVEVDRAFSQLEKITEENMNPSIIATRALRQVWLSKGELSFDEAVNTVTTKERQEQAKAQAAATGEVGGEKKKAPAPATTTPPLEYKTYAPYGGAETPTPTPTPLAESTAPTTPPTPWAQEFGEQIRQGLASLSPEDQLLLQEEAKNPEKGAPIFARIMKKLYLEKKVPAWAIFPGIPKE